MGRYAGSRSGLSNLEAQLDEEFEFFVGDDQESASDDEIEDEFERYVAGDNGELDEEFEGYDEEATDGFGERFFELSQREWEDEYELEGAIDRILGEMEREYFFGRLVKGLKSKGKALLRKGLKAAQGQIPAFKALQGITQLARGDLRGLLRSLAKAGLASAIPGGSIALPALQALGFESEQDEETEREAWDNFAAVAREAFEALADNLTPTADQPLEASRLATTSFRTALNRRPAAGYRSGRYLARRGGAGRRKIRVTARSGDIVVIRVV